MEEVVYVEGHVTYKWGPEAWSIVVAIAALNSDHYAPPRVVNEALMGFQVDYCMIDRKVREKKDQDAGLHSGYYFSDFLVERYKKLLKEKKESENS